MPVTTLYQNENCRWIDCENATPDDLMYLHNEFHINSLMLEDTTDANHLPKYEEEEGVHFYLMRENTETERKSLNTISDISTKIGIFILGSAIITIHRMPTKSISGYREKLKNEKKALTPDLIALNIAIRVLKTFDDESIRLLELLDRMENDIFLNDTNKSNQIKRLYKLKRMAGLNYRILNVSSDWVSHYKILKISDAQYTDLSDKYKDVIADFDHLNIQITNLLSMFLALSDQKANQVMKLLAMYSVYFLPITFIAGIYGMNFDFMPELHHEYGYYGTLGLMGFIVVVTFIYFRKKKW